MPPSRPRGGIPGELLRLVRRLVVAGIVSVVGLSLAAFAVSIVVGLLSLLVRVVAGEEVAKGLLGVSPKLFGLLVFVALIRFALSLHGRQWRLVADLYGAAPGDSPRVRRFPEQVIVNAGGLAFRLYVPLTVGIRAAKAADVEIVVSDKLYNWIRGHGPDGAFETAQAREFAAVRSGPPAPRPRPRTRTD